MESLTEATDRLFDVLQVLGTVAFAVSGAMAAIRKGMDWLGVVVLGMVAATGGGTVRDLLVGVSPVSWVDDAWPVLLAAGVAALTIPLVLWARRPLENENLVLAFDAGGLAVFTVLGVDVALFAGTSSAVAVLLGVVAGTTGGVLRDVLINRVPVLLSEEVYAAAAAAGAVLYVVLLELEVNRQVATWLPVVTILAVRGVSLWRGWSLPTVDVDLEEPDSG